MMLKYLTLILILITIAFSASPTSEQAQKFPRGSVKVFDRTLNRERPISGVTVEIQSNGKKYETFTDSDGNFSFPSLKGQWASMVPKEVPSGMWL